MPNLKNLKNKKTFLIELAKQPFDQELVKKHGLSLVTSIFEAEIVILSGGLYCCKSDEGYQILQLLHENHSDKKMLIVNQSRSISSDFVGKRNIFEGKHGKFEFEG